MVYFLFCKMYFYYYSLWHIYCFAQRLTNLKMTSNGFTGELYVTFGVIVCKYKKNTKWA